MPIRRGLLAVVLGLGICGTSVYAGNWNFTCYNSAGKIDAKHIKITAKYNFDATTMRTIVKTGTTGSPTNVNTGPTYTGKPGVQILIENTNTGDMKSITLHGNYPPTPQDIHIYVP